MKRKILSLLLVMAIGMTLLVGCGGTDKDANADSNQGNDTNVSQNEQEENESLKKGNSYGVTSENNPYGYIIPTELGSSLESMIFQLEGDYYSFPMPLSALFENGWELEGVFFNSEWDLEEGYNKETMLLESGDIEEIDLVNPDGKKLDTVRIINDTENALPLEDCLVSIIWIDRANGEFDLNLPEGVTMKSDMDLLEQLTDIKSEVFTIGYCWYSNEEHTHVLTIEYQPEEEYVQVDEGIVSVRFTYFN